MLFHEIYGSYYQTVSAILREAVNGTLTKKRLHELVQTHAFGESFLSIPDGLTGERWLRSLLLDPRIRLFDVDMHGLEAVKPLFTPEMFVFFDRYADGDDYHDPGYIARFKTILTALREEKDLYISFTSGRQKQPSLVVTPHTLEYSEKDDCFRLLAAGPRRDWVIRLSRITDCSIIENSRTLPPRPPKPETLVFELEDTRNALERVLLHFSHLEKETKRLDETHYRVTLKYDPADETEMVIRVLSFGPMIRVTEPPRFVERLRERIDRQRELAVFSPGNSETDAVYSQPKGRENND